MRPLLTSLIAVVLAASSAGPGLGNQLKAIEAELTHIVEGARASVVSISAEAPPGQDGCRHRRIGTGVLIDSTGYVATTADVVKDAQRVCVTTTAGRKYVAHVLGSDPESKLVLLKISPERKSWATLANSDRLRIGQWAITLGNSLGVSPTVSIGLVSGFQGHGRLIQVTTLAFPGNSGAPVFDSDGQVIGIVTAAIMPPRENLITWPAVGPHSLSPFASPGASAIMLAVPANRTREIARRMAARAPAGRPGSGWLGVTAREFSTGPHTGVQIVQVLPGSPAQRAGIKPNDIVLKYAGKSPESIRELVSLVRATRVNRRVEVRVKRDDLEISTWVTLGKCPQEIAAQQRQ